MHDADIHILGGGPAGLAAGYYAKKRGLDFVLFEAGAQLGGNCRTLRLGDFLFDTGAHRLHDKDPEVTGEIKGLLGDQLAEVAAPSEIFLRDEFFRFPLQMGNLVKRLDRQTLLQIAAENLRLKRRPPAANFGEFALNQYGQTLANLFLLNYSQKLWGADPHQLAPDVSGGRMKGLDLASFVREVLLGRASRPGHLDGSFLYPKYGIGMIVDKMSERIGSERVRLNSRVSRLVHSRGRLQRVILNGDVEVAVSTVVNTLPLTLAAKMLDPPPPPELLAAANEVTYRHLILCVFGLDRPSFSPNASLYFPEAEFPFTRLYEPKNRSRYMAPEGQTAIVLELPCFRADAVWNMSSEDLRRLVWQALQRVQPIGESAILCFATYKLPFAYPVLKVGLAEHVQRLVAYFQTFENLRLTGRSALFRYVHLHDLFKAGKELVLDLPSAEG